MNAIKELKKHHIFLFPTLGENYGHVIQEALSAGCPVILSDQTPWQDIKKYRVGHIFELNNLNGYRNIIEYYSEMNGYEFQEVCNNVLSYVIEKGNKKINSSGYKNMFDTLIE